MFNSRFSRLRGFSLQSPQMTCDSAMYIPMPLRFDGTFPRSILHNGRVDKQYEMPATIENTGVSYALDPGRSAHLRIGGGQTKGTERAGGASLVAHRRILPTRCQRESDPERESVIWERYASDLRGRTSSNVNVPLCTRSSSCG